MFNISNIIANNMKYGSYDQLVEKHEADIDALEDIVVSLLLDIVDLEVESEHTDVYLESIESAFDKQMVLIRRLKQELAQERKLVDDLQDELWFRGCPGI